MWSRTASLCCLWILCYYFMYLAMTWVMFLFSIPLIVDLEHLFTCMCCYSLFCVSTCGCVYLFVWSSAWLWMSACLLVCLFVCLSICLSVCSSACLFIFLHVWLSSCLSVCSSSCLSDCLSLHLSVHLPLYPFVAKYLENEELKHDSIFACR